MGKLIRNDYTLINRLKILADKKLEEERHISIFDKKLKPIFRIHMKINDLIEEIKEDVENSLNQRLSNAISKISDENILNIQTEMSLLWFIDNKQ